MIEEGRRGWRDPELVTLFAEVTQRGLSTGLSPWASDLTVRQSLENMRRELSK
jgi:hypothetical protein